MTDNQAPQEATISEQTALLKVFVGTWHTTGEVVASSSAPATKVDATDTYEWLPGSYALIHYAKGIIGDDKTRSIEIIGYDKERTAFFAPFFDDQGGAGWEEARADGNTWIFSRRKCYGSKTSPLHGSL